RGEDEQVETGDGDPRARFPRGDRPQGGEGVLPAEGGGRQLRYGGRAPRPPTCGSIEDRETRQVWRGRHVPGFRGSLEGVPRGRPASQGPEGGGDEGARRPPRTRARVLRQETREPRGPAEDPGGVTRHGSRVPEEQ